MFLCTVSIRLRSTVDVISALCKDAQIPPDAECVAESWADNAWGEALKSNWPAVTAASQGIKETLQVYAAGA